MTGICSGIKRDGTRCTQGVGAGSQYCYNHDPALAPQRRRAARRAGKSKPSRELASIKRQLQDLVDGVLSEEVNRSDAAVCGQLLNYVTRAVGMELKLKEVEELEQRLSDLEGLLEKQGGQSRWG